ncbi:MFS transporter [Sciscionella sediminilitoris]|uniref:MFS transporter n=1 Tax=Sciscionella sediminilitoris TaxID=1445613 RepID=UPI0007C7DC4B|nr:MFS transporter [Sciscionella sp. SE31]
MAATRRMLRKLTTATVWGQGLDGYDLGVISVVMPMVVLHLHMSPVWAGLIGASSLIGIFFGGPVFGMLTDRFGRRTTFTVDLVLFLITALLQVFVTDPAQLFVIRLVMGIAIGAEYAIGATMLAEFSPARGRGRRIAGLEVAWFAGYLAAVAISYGLLDLAGVSWNWVLATGALPALYCLIVRRGLPESPRWLLSRGRTEEARAIIDTYLGGQAAYRGEDFHGERPSLSRGTLHALFAPGQCARTVFACVFYACLVAPYFAIFTFAPSVLATLHLSDPAAGTITVNALAACGALAGMLVIERIGRRRLLIGPFWIMAACLCLVGIWGQAPGIIVVGCFAVFAFFNAASSDLTPVYPAELFPTEIRTTGTGLAAAASRIGAALGTFALPSGLNTIGVGPSMLIAAGICVIGAVTAQLLAPETTGLTLTRATRPGMQPLTTEPPHSTDSRSANH